MASREINVWRTRAQSIPDQQLRQDALDSIAHKREHAEGAALFSILPAHRDLQLLRVLVAYQTIWDFLDTTSEHGSVAGELNGRQLHLALVEALDPTVPISNYYKHHPWKNDGGYLQALVKTCREGCLALPSYSRVRSFVLPGVVRCSIQSLNHDPDPSHRSTALKAWAEQEFPDGHTLPWFELTAAASAFIPHVFLALAAELSCKESDVADVHSAYFPWTSLAIAMLDSYVDQADDLASESHSYISHYNDDELAVKRLCEIVNKAMREVRDLPNSDRHTVIVGSMIAMYLSKRITQTTSTRIVAQRLSQAGGPLIACLLPILRMWRTVCNQPVPKSNER